METGTCSRWITVGCCCEAMSDFDAALNLECAALMLCVQRNCVQPGRYSNWTLQIGQGIAATDGHYEIECNTVSGNTDIGINVWNSAIRNDLSFNTVTAADEGIRFALDCPGQNLIRCNTVQNTAGRGLFYDDARTDNQFNTGNRWINTGGAEFVQGIYQTVQSEYFVPDQVPWRPVPVDPLQGWFFPDGTLPMPTCNVVCQPGLLPPGGGADSPFDTDIAGGDPAGEGWDQWRRERYLLYKLAAYPELAPTGSLMANFQNARATSTVGKLVGIGLQSAGLFAPASAEQAVLEANKQAIATKSRPNGGFRCPVGRVPRPRNVRRPADPARSTEQRRGHLGGAEQRPAGAIANRPQRAGRQPAGPTRQRDHNPAPWEQPIFIAPNHDTRATAR